MNRRAGIVARIARAPARLCAEFATCVRKISPEARRTAGDVLAALLLADAGLLAHLLAQVVELGAIDVPDRHHLDLLDLRRVHGKRSLDADPERLLAHGERLANAGALALDHDALEDLDPRALSLDHAEMDAHGVARLELRDVGSQLALLEELDGARHERKGPAGRGGMVAERLRGARHGQESVTNRPQASSARRINAARCGSAASRRRRPCRSDCPSAEVPSAANRTTARGCRPS